MTKEEKKALYTCNIGDFLRTFQDKKYASPDARNLQFGDTLVYLSKYNMQGTTKECEFFDLVYAAKTSLINQAVNRPIDKKKESHYQKMGQDYKGSFDAVTKFINDPIDYLQDTFKAFGDEELDEEEIDPDKKEFNRRLKENAKELGGRLQNQRERYKEYEAQAKAKDLEIRILNKLSNKAINLDDVFEKNKGGFLERTFGTTSTDYKNLKTAFNDYRNPNSVYHGNDSHVEIEAIKYLEHAIPGFRWGGDLPTKAQIDALEGTRKDRTMFCVSVLESINEKREQQAAIDELVSIIQNEYEVEDESLIDEEQNDFQNHLQNDLSESSDLIQQDEINNDEVEAQKEVEQPAVK